MDPLAPALLERLRIASQAARTHAHVPYSHYAVGAAVLDDQGAIHAGCNVENAAYPQGWCAEATALGAMLIAPKPVPMCRHITTFSSDRVRNTGPQ